MALDGRAIAHADAQAVWGDDSGSGLLRWEHQFDRVGFFPFGTWVRGSPFV
jgi:hypothetical protein